MPDGEAAATVCGTFLAFDFGTKRIGVAVGNSISDTAQPLVTLPLMGFQMMISPVGSTLLRGSLPT